ncbi:MAG: DNA alkylation repair protein [Ruminococcus sp.]|nr:DNA alkylation repair protein [Ruminococcus sp.]
MRSDEIRELLFQARDEEYGKFQSKLIPEVADNNFIGVRTPELRKIAKTLSKYPNIGDFLNELPHRYFDEDQLHSFIISEIKDMDKCIEEVERFLPYVNNWATCDQLTPKAFKKHKDKLLEKIKVWIASDKTYTVRFAMEMLMTHFLDDEFDISYPEMVAGVKSEEYYIRMMQAWYFATALAKQYEAVLPFITEKKLEQWTHNKAIQKATESRRITPEQKDFLRNLKFKKYNL